MLSRVKRFLWTHCTSKISIITIVVQPISIIFGSVVLLQSEMFTSADVALWWQATVQSNVGVTVGCSAAPRRQVSLKWQTDPRGQSIYSPRVEHETPQSDLRKLTVVGRSIVLPTALWPGLLQGWFPSTKHWPLQRTASVSSSVYRTQRTSALGVKKIHVLPVVARPWKTSISKIFIGPWNQKYCCSFSACFQSLT